eukprot:TRINITY_DN1292_c2_g1_i6.p1 TRINITY_DN1292_c2_g1~~TRINITY_DN1292_c2_g1_i6.p1  ORF type:complete len:1395 (-),score=504.58 TRINITY_DN1292_c2_g1_i6:1111-5295(-)
MAEVFKNGYLESLVDLSGDGTPPSLEDVAEDMEYRELYPFYLGEIGHAVAHADCVLALSKLQVRLIDRILNLCKRIPDGEDKKGAQSHRTREDMRIMWEYYIVLFTSTFTDMNDDNRELVLQIFAKFLDCSDHSWEWVVRSITKALCCSHERASAAMVNYLYDWLNEEAVTKKDKKLRSPSGMKIVQRQGVLRLIAACAGIAEFESVLERQQHLVAKLCNVVWDSFDLLNAQFSKGTKKKVVPFQETYLLELSQVIYLLLDEAMEPNIDLSTRGSLRVKLLPCDLILKEWDMDQLRELVEFLQMYTGIGDMSEKRAAMEHKQVVKELGKQFKKAELERAVKEYEAEVVQLEDTVLAAVEKLLAAGPIYENGKDFTYEELHWFVNVEASGGQVLSSLLAFNYEELMPQFIDYSYALEDDSSHMFFNAICDQFLCLQSDLVPPSTGNAADLRRYHERIGNPQDTRMEAERMSQVERELDEEFQRASTQHAGSLLLLAMMYLPSPDMQTRVRAFDLLYRLSTSLCGYMNEEKARAMDRLNLSDDEFEIEFYGARASFLAGLSTIQTSLARVSDLSAGRCAIFTELVFEQAFREVSHISGEIKINVLKALSAWANNISLLKEPTLPTVPKDLRAFKNQRELLHELFHLSLDVQAELGRIPPELLMLWERLGYAEPPEAAGQAPANLKVIMKYIIETSIEMADNQEFCAQIVISLYRLHPKGVVGILVEQLSFNRRLELQTEFTKTDPDPTAVPEEEEDEEDSSGRSTLRKRNRGEDDDQDEEEDEDDGFDDDDDDFVVLTKDEIAELSSKERKKYKKELKARKEAQAKQNKKDKKSKKSKKDKKGKGKQVEDDEENEEEDDEEEEERQPTVSEMIDIESEAIITMLTTLIAEDFEPLIPHVHIVINYCFLHLKGLEDNSRFNETVRKLMNHAIFAVVTRCGTLEANDETDRQYKAFRQIFMMGIQPKFQLEFLEMDENPHHKVTADDPTFSSLWYGKKVMFDDMLRDLHMYMNSLNTSSVALMSREALQWCIGCSDSKMAIKASQIYRAMPFPVNTKSLGHFVKAIGAAVNSLYNREQDKMSRVEKENEASLYPRVQSMLRTLHAIILHLIDEGKLVKYPIVFWCVAGLLRCEATKYIHVYEQAMRMMLSMLNSDDFVDYLNSEKTQRFQSQEPRASAKFWSYSMDWMPVFEGILPSLLQGVTLPSVENITLHVLCRTCYVYNDDLIDSSPARVLLQTMSVLPWLLHTVLAKDILDSSTVDSVEVSLGSGVGIRELGVDNQIRVYTTEVVNALSDLLKHFGYDDVEEIVQQFASGGDNPEMFLNDLCDVLAAEFFPVHVFNTASFLTSMMRFGPKSYVRGRGRGRERWWLICCDRRVSEERGRERERVTECGKRCGCV